MLAIRQQCLAIGGLTGGQQERVATFSHERVTAVTSARNQEFVRSLGADRAIDYATTDFSAEGGRYTIVADCVGKATFVQCRRAAKRGGVILQVAPSLGAMMSGVFASGGLRVVAGVATGKPGDMALLAEIAAQGAFKPPIGHVFPLGDIVQAHRLSESGRKRGHVVVAMD